MAASKKTRVRVNPGILMDAEWVNDHKILVTKQWTEVPSTVAKKMVGSMYNGRPRFEFEDDSADEAGLED